MYLLHAGSKKSPDIRGKVFHMSSKFVQNPATVSEVICLKQKLEGLDPGGMTRKLDLKTGNVADTREPETPGGQRQEVCSALFFKQSTNNKVTAWFRDSVRGAESVRCTIRRFLGV